jgi:hypothetical protein
VNFLALMPFLLLSVDESWKVLNEKDGIRVEAREQESGFEEVRVSVQVEHPADAACKVIWDDAHHLDAGLAKREPVQEKPNERWTYERVKAPFADRDYTLHMKREKHKNGCKIGFETQNDKGPPPQGGVVRIPVIRGTWEIESAAPEGSHITYTVYAEPGGGVSPLFSRTPQRDRSVAFVKSLIARIDAVAKPANTTKASQ